MDQKTKCELSLYCLSTETDETRAAKLEQLSSSDWDGVIQQSAIHGVAPLLYHRLKTLNLSANIPDSIVQKLQKIYLQSLERNKYLYHELSKVLRTLQNDGTPIILLKGIALAETVYQNIALRPMEDVDLLVKKEDLYRTEITLLNLGYAIPEYYIRKREQYEKNHHHLPPYFNEKEMVRIELHWNIHRPSSLFKIEIDGMWERARPAKIANVEVLVLSPEDMILHLCLHASLQHKFCIDLRRIYDISKTIQHYQDEIDWKRLLSTANEYGISKFIYCTLSVARKMLEIEIPDGILNDLKPDNFEEQLLEIIQDYIFLMPTLILLPSALLKAIGSDGFQNKMKILLRDVFPSPETLREIYSLKPNSTKVYFYYFIRLFDLLIRRSKVMLQIAFHTKDVKLLSEQQAVIERWLEAE